MVDVNFIINNLAVYGYPLMFVLMYFGGPTVVFISAFLASFGLFNIFIVWLLAMVGDFLGDYFHFFVGGRGYGYIKKRLSDEGVASRSIVHLREMMDRKLFRALFLIKLAPPPISTAGLFLAGTFKDQRKKVLLYAISISFIMRTFFLLLGYYIGSYFYSVIGYFERVEIIVAIVVTIVILFFVGNKMLSNLSEKMIEKA